MSPSRRRILIIATVLLIFAGSAWMLFQSSTREALERAEAFRFRRMLVNREGDTGGYRFFYATNRDVVSPDGPVADRFGNARESRLAFGFFDTDIEPSLGLGMLIDPTDWFQSQEIKLRDVRPLARAEFVAELRSQVMASPHRSLLINVNGFRERFQSALRKTAFVAHVLDIDSPLLVFDWPGDQGSTLRGYRRAQAIARESGEDLAELLRIVVDEVGPERVWLLANSMGGDVVVSAITRLNERPDWADADFELEDVILTAPDVSHEEFGRQFKSEIDAVSRNVTIYVSSNDRALLMSRILNRGRRLGESTVDLGNPDQSDEAARALEMLSPEDERVTLVDVTPINRTRNFHNFSLETPEFFDDLYLRLLNVDAPDTRRKYRVRTPAGTSYWVLTRGR